MSKPIVMLGPTRYEIGVTVKEHIRLNSHTEFTDNISHFYDGYMLKIARFVKHFQIDYKFYTYAGLDYHGEKIKEQLYIEKIKHQLFLFEQYKTPTVIKITKNNLNHFVGQNIFNIENVVDKIINDLNKKINIFIIDPIISSSYVHKLIKKFKKSIFIASLPHDNDITIFEYDNVHILVPMRDLYKLNAMLDYATFTPESFFMHTIFKNKAVIAEYYDELYTFNHLTNKLRKLRFPQISSEIINDAFCAGYIAGVSCGQDSQAAAIWGINAALHKQSRTNIDFELFIGKLNKFTWI